MILLWSTFLKIVGVIVVAMGCLILTKKKLIISRQYDMIFLCSVLSINMVYNTNWPRQYLLLIAAFWLLSVIISYIIMAGRFTITNLKTAALLTTLTKSLDEKGVLYELTDQAIILVNDDNKKIIYSEFLNSSEINFRRIRKLPFYKELLNSLFLKVKLVKDNVFPSTGVFCVIMGIIFLALTAFSVR